MPTPKLNEWEKEIASYWEAHSIFEKSIEQRPADKPYVFYDGPPFATGLPHYGHIVGSVMKDLVPRYFTMKGHRVERKWGWDCHGLPIENLAEKKLDIKNKNDIEELGVDVFNETCQSMVLEYTGEWEKIIPRLGRWVDMKNAYRTMDKNFMESIWWVCKQIHEKGLLYEGYRPVHVCPRCETVLSKFEVNQGYENVKDLSVVVTFPLTSGAYKGVNLLAWTTTPWTLPGNVLTAVHPELEYVVVAHDEKEYIVAKDRVETIFENKDHVVEKTAVVDELIGSTYEPLFPFFKEHAGGFVVVSADFVTAEDGTGIVHIAPGFGEDDFNLGQKEEVEPIQHVHMNGQFVDEVAQPLSEQGYAVAGVPVKQKGDTLSVDIEMVKVLAHSGRLFGKQKIEHSYPHCWRCDTPLINFATNSWFVAVSKIVPQLQETAQNINWVPSHIKDGRFGDGLAHSPDWSVSRSRYWGTPLPVWKSEDGGMIVVGSVAELQELTGETIDDLHKHHVDKLTFEKGGKVYTRVSEVLDCWVESGCRPYGQMHYPFENKEKFEASFPAQFIAEGVDQTRLWFHKLHVLGNILFGSEAYRNVIVNGIVLAEDGRKMSKRFQNYPDPMEIVEKYSADALRWYMINSPVTSAEDIRFSEKEVDEIYKKVMLMTWNITAFYQMYAEKNTGGAVCGTNHPLDQWIMARLQQTVEAVTSAWDAYHLAKGTRAMREFIDECSTWYVRRSRDRFKSGDVDAQAAAATLREVVMTLAKLMAPVAPFLAEKMYQTIGGDLESVHLEMWPEVGGCDDAVLKQMEAVRQIVELGLSARSEAKMRIRQPLQTLVYSGVSLDEQLVAIIAEELNIKEVVSGEVTEGQDTVVKTYGEFSIGLVTTLSEELKYEAVAREIVRAANAARKNGGFTIDDHGTVHVYAADKWVHSAVEQFTNYIEEGSRCTFAWTEQADESAVEVSVHGATVFVSVTQ